MRIGIISGSHRAEAETLRVCQYIEGQIKKLNPDAQTYFFSLSKNPLPLWDDDVWEGAERWKKAWGPISQELQKCDGFVIASPEWGGMVPAGLKNFFLLCGAGELRHKPGMIVSVSASRNGAYPIAELRSSSYKNTGIVYIPDHVIVRDVKDMFTGKDDETDEYLRTRTDYSLKMLFEYSKAFKMVRESGVIDAKNYGFGM